jgi:D-alanyl-D-alanine carboxypeptidase
MSTQSLSASVGRGGVNRHDDVVIVQNLLIARGLSTIGRANGICGRKTIQAIQGYQAGFLVRPDGRVDPGGLTWRHLSGDDSGDTPPLGAGAITQTVPRSSLVGEFNEGLASPSNAFMLDLLGAPRSSFDSDCREPTLERLRRNIVRDTVGPFRVAGPVPAVLSLKRVMADIARDEPEVHAALGTAGMLCCRLVRNSTTAISNHSWGTAIDLTLGGVLDEHGDGRVQIGLARIAPIFNRHGWFWGATFPTEDAMHFEGSRSAVEQWAGELA